MNCVLILVSPKGAGNVGGVARLLGNFEVGELRIVDPRCRLDSLECKQMSMQGYHFVEKAKIFKTLEDAQSDLSYSVAFSGRRYDDPRPRMTVFDFYQEIPNRFSDQDRIGLVFGREEWGLTLEELDRCHVQVEIPSSEKMPSINLTSAVAIALSELYRGRRSKQFVSAAEAKERPKKEQEDIFFERVFRVMDLVQFTNPQNPISHLTDLRSMYHRADLSDRDLRILFGILSGIERHIK